MDGIDYPTVISAVLVIIAALAGHKWGFAKGKLHMGRQLIDSVDDALADNTISDTEYASISKVLPFLMQKQ